MNRELAISLLELADEFSKGDLQSAYLEKVKSEKGSENFEEVLKDLNVARDVLNDQFEPSNALIPIIVKEMSLINKEQRVLARRQEAREEFSDSISSIENRVVGQIKQSRDTAGLLAAGAAGTAFFRENISEVIGAASISPFMSKNLLIFSAMLGVLAFFSHRRSKQVEVQISHLKRVLTRQRTIERVLSIVFLESNNLEEVQIEDKLIKAISRTTGVRPTRRHGRGNISRVLDIYASIGIPVTPHSSLGYRSPAPETVLPRPVGLPYTSFRSTQQGGP